MKPDEFLRQHPLPDGIVYYPGSGIDWGPFRLFAEHGQCSLIVYSDYGIKRNDAERFIASIPEWNVASRVEALPPEDLGVASWNDCWPPNPDKEPFFGPKAAFALRATLKSGHRSVRFHFLATEAIQTYCVLVAAEIKPAAVVLQDHGLGCNWASFGGKSYLFKCALKVSHLPNYLLVADNTEPWPKYECASEYQQYAGQMAYHQRAIFRMKQEIGGNAMPKTWAGRSTFSYTGSVAAGTRIIYGQGHPATVTATQYAVLRRTFLNRVVPVGTSRTDAPNGSLGAWLLANVTPTAIASYVAPILIREGYAQRVGHNIRITR